MKIKSSLKILIIDDSPEAISIEKVLLRKKGFRNVVNCSNGEEALKMLYESLETGSPIELILADWQMPKLSGLDLLKKVRDDPTLREFPYIMVTADNDLEHVREAITNGVSSYLLKPINNNTLMTRIWEVLSEA